MLARMPTEAVRKLFSVEEYDRMVEVGILTKYDRVELIEGEILEMSPIGDRHSACTDRATMLLVPLLQGQAIVRVQGPVRLSDNTKPQPDITLLNPREDFYASSSPLSRDALLVIEVAETSIRYDRGPKLAIYAKYGVGEVWIEDLNTDTLLVFRDRHPDGYATSLVLKPGDSVSPVAFPDVALSVSALLGTSSLT
jgi:Uma2 family endonuclease